MNFMKPPRIILFPLLLSLFCCDKDELTELEKLPPETHSGQDTFGCLVNGKAWVMEKRIGAATFYQTGTFMIYTGHNGFRAFISLVIDDLNLDAGKQYQLGEVSQTAPSDYAIYNEVDMNCEYYTTSTYTGSLTISHIDKVNYTVSGTFEFEAWSDACAKVIKVTDGRFDVYYAP